MCYLRNPPTFQIFWTQMASENAWQKLVRKWTVLGGNRSGNQPSRKDEVFFRLTLSVWRRIGIRRQLSIRWYRPCWVHTKMGINVTNAPKSILYEGGCNFNLVNDVKFSNDLAKAAEGPTLVTNASKALDIASRAFFARKLLILLFGIILDLRMLFL